MPPRPSSLEVRRHLRYVVTGGTSSREVRRHGRYVGAEDVEVDQIFGKIQHMSTQCLRNVLLCRRRHETLKRVLAATLDVIDIFHQKGLVSSLQYLNGFHNAFFQRVFLTTSCVHRGTNQSFP